MTKFFVVLTNSITEKKQVSEKLNQYLKLIKKTKKKLISPKNK